MCVVCPCHYVSCTELYLASAVDVCLLLGIIAVGHVCNKLAHHSHRRKTQQRHRTNSKSEDKESAEGKDKKKSEQVTEFAIVTLETTGRGGMSHSSLPQQKFALEVAL